MSVNTYQLSTLMIGKMFTDLKFLRYKYIFKKKEVFFLSCQKSVQSLPFFLLKKIYLVILINNYIFNQPKFVKTLKFSD